MNKKLRKLILLCLLLAMALTLVTPAAFAEEEEPGDTTEQVDSNPNPDPNPNPNPAPAPVAPTNPEHPTPPNQGSTQTPDVPSTGGQENQLNQQDDQNDDDSQDENQNKGQQLMTAQNGEGENGENGQGENQTPPANGEGGTTTCANGEHTWDSGSVTTEPTCTTPGVKTFTCTKCQETKTEEVAAKGHSTTPMAAREPNGCFDGNIECFVCAYCGSYFTDAAGTNQIPYSNVFIPGTNHTLVAKPARAKTCTTPGSNLFYECNVCNKAFKDAAGTIKTSPEAEAVPASHNLQLVSGKDATCTEPGVVQHYKCADCGKLFTDKDGNNEITNVTIPALGHNVVFDDSAKVIQKQTCTTEGISVATCKNKGCSFTLTKTDAALDHDWQIESQTNYTCSTDGKTVWKCQRAGCGATKTETTPATHNWQWDESQENKYPDCTTGGTYHLICPNCNEKKTVTEGPKHSWGPWETTKEPTCTENGTKTRTCLVNEAHVETAEIPKLGHKVTTWITTNPTCTEAGSKIGECMNDNCPNKGIAGLDGSYVIIELPALGHQYTAECENKWNHVLTCQRTGCGHKETEGHNYCHWHKLDKQSDSKTVTWQRVCEDCGWAETWSQDVAASPRTGDENNVAVYSLVCVLTLSAAGAAALLLKKKENG